MENDENVKEYLFNRNQGNLKKKNYTKQDLKENYKIGIKYYEEIENKIDNE